MNFLIGLIWGVSLLVAVLFSLIVYVTGKGDAMSGGGGVRTTFKGKASFEDTMAKITLYMGVAFMAFMLLLDILSNVQQKS